MEIDRKNLLTIPSHQETLIRKKKRKRLILAHRSFLTAQKGHWAGNYAFNHFNALYGPANGLYSDIKKSTQKNVITLTGNRQQDIERSRIKGLDNTREHQGKADSEDFIEFKGIKVSDSFWKTGKKEIKFLK